MKRYIRTNQEYFNWYNKYKDIYVINSIHLTRKYIVIEYEERSDTSG